MVAGANGHFWVAVRRIPLGSIAMKGTVVDVAPDGTLTAVYVATGDPRRLLRTPEGGVIVFESIFKNIMDAAEGKLTRLAPDGSTSVLVPPTPTLGQAGALAFGTGGELLIELAQTPNTWTRVGVDGALTAVPARGWFPEVVDARGRVYSGWDFEIPGIPPKIMRKDPAVPDPDPDHPTFEVVAGPGGQAFTGSGVDDGIGSASELQFTPAGDLLFLDGKNKQIKRIPADKLK